MPIKIRYCKKSIAETETKAKVTLGNSSQEQLKKEARSWVSEAKKEIKAWEKFLRY